MESAPISSMLCPTCHLPVKPTDYFCANCGYKLKPVPPPTSVTGQLELYFKSFLLPPMGFIWGYRYLKQPDPKSKIVGSAAIIITLAILIIILVSTIGIINTVNDQVNSQLGTLNF
jgi:hypothetical protein